MLILIEPPNQPGKVRTQLIALLKEKLGFAQIICLNAMTAIGAYFEQKTGIIIDIGFQSTNIVPIYEGYPMMHQFYHMETGSHIWENRVKRFLKNKNPEYWPLSFPITGLHVYTLLKSIQSQSHEIPIPSKTIMSQYASIPPNIELISIMGDKLDRVEQLIEPNELEEIQNPELVRNLIAFLGDTLDPAKNQLKEHSIPDIVQMIINKSDSEIRDDISSQILISGGISNNYFFIDILQKSFSPLPITLGRCPEFIPVFGAEKLYKNDPNFGGFMKW